MSQNGLRLGRSLGSRDPDHIARWLAAMNESKAKLHCTAIAETTKAPCRGVPLKFADKCSIHCRGAERIAVDKLRLAWLRRGLRRSIGDIARANVQARIDKIERRRQRWAWKSGPTLLGSTIALRPHDLARAEAWLREVAAVEPDRLTARARDQCLWAAALRLSCRYDEGMAVMKVKRALQAEEEWRTKTFQAA
jgi:hypothetical protein